MSDIKPIYKKGVPYHVFKCVDCGKEHLAQKTNGGQPRSPRCLSCAAIIRGTGRVCSPETKAKISASLMGHPSSDKVHAHDWDTSVETRRKISLSQLGKPSRRRGYKASLETIEKMRIAARLVAQRDGMKEHMSKMMKGRYDGPNHPQYGIPRSMETLKKIYTSVGSYNKTEARLDKIIQRVLPSQYKYNGGAQLGFRIHRHIPDFVNVNGQKKIIELNGCFWHCCEQCNIVRHPKGVSAVFIRDRDKRFISDSEALGYKTLTIWEHDMADEGSVIKKLEDFNEG